MLLVVCVGGMAPVLVAAFRHRDATRPPPFDEGIGSSTGQRVRAAVQRVSALASAGLVAGVLVLGLGLRLMMRIIAATSPDSVQGRRTDAEEIVGEISLGGSTFLVIFGGAVGGVFAVLGWIVFRPWFPERSVAAGLVVAAIGAGLLARPSGLIDPDNHDFVILSPVWLALVMTFAVLVAHGVAFAVLADHWAATWPASRWSVRGVVRTVPVLLVTAMCLMLVIPAVVLVVVAVHAVWIRPRLDGRLGWFDRLVPVGSAVLVAAAVVGAGWVAVTTVQVLML